ELPDHVEAAATAREVTRHQLADWGIGEETVFAAELVVSELVTNAVRHGAPPIRLRLLLDRGMTCELYDGGSAAPHLRQARPSDESGRGLFIVSEVADRWGVRFTDSGKVVWTEQELSDRP
ncbi:ATP-binding protein, partial [Streptomyces carpinensis]